MMKHALGEVFQREGSYWFGRAFVTIYDIKLTKDLQIARIYLSVYNVESKEDVLDSIRQNQSKVRHLLGQRIRNKVRVIPELEFFLDETLDEVFRMDALLDKLKKEERPASDVSGEEEE